MRKKLLLIASAAMFLSFTSGKIAVLYRSLNPKSIPEHLAFYHLFSDTPEGKRALADAWQLLSGSSKDPVALNHLPKSAIDAIVSLTTKSEGVETTLLDEAELGVIQKLAQHLPNRRLKGYLARSEEDVLRLAADQVDLARGLFLSKSQESLNEEKKIASYEALIDLMALQILTGVKLSDPPEIKIRAINRFIFEEMKYRFPPHSTYAKDIDLYTYLPSVIDSRRGVCLGVSILYLCLSQRLDLPLEAITPPGHIYVRYHSDKKTINIETTARGIHIDTEEYLGIESKEFIPRTIKDVIGLAYFNEASVHWQSENYSKALKCYEKATLYLPEDLLLQELLGYTHLFLRNEEEGTFLLRRAFEGEKSDAQVVQKCVMEDFLNGDIDAEGIRIMHLYVDEKRESLLKKQLALSKVLEKWPRFKAGHFHLGVLELQLNCYKKALAAFQEYEKLEQHDPTAEYFLSQLSLMRSDYPAAWRHLHRAEELLKDRPSIPETLKILHRELAACDPE